MKHFSIFAMGLAAFLCTGCYTTSLLSAPYVTAVYSSPQPASKVIPASHDLSVDLDLQAVGAALAQSSTVREFEILLNDSYKGISNLDLDGDGYVDYIRVLETNRGYVYVLQLQAVLGRDIYQDVASIVIERPQYSDWHIEIIGEPYIYGRDYYVLPIYYTNPLILNCYRTKHYSGCWSSPWRWGFYAPYYSRMEPLHYRSYQQNVINFISVSKYCRDVQYPGTCHCPDYGDINRSVRRNDYGSAHMEKSFSNRTANYTRENSAMSRAANAGQIKNASDIHKMQENSHTAEPSHNVRESDNSGSGSNGSTRSSRASSSHPSSDASSYSRYGNDNSYGTERSSSSSGSVRSSGSSSGSSRSSRTSSSSGSSVRSSSSSSSESVRSSGSGSGSPRSSRTSSSSGSSTRSSGSSSYSRYGSGSSSHSSSSSSSSSTSRSSGSSTSSSPRSSRSK